MQASGKRCHFRTFILVDRILRIRILLSLVDPNGHLRCRRSIVALEIKEVFLRAVKLPLN